VRSGIAESKFPPLVQQKADLAMKSQDAMVQRALAMGVRIALGPMRPSTRMEKMRLSLLC
jgi:hypothetical protein